MSMNRKKVAGAAMALLLAAAGGVSAQSDVSVQRPKAYLVSDAHLDTQWNWDVQTTIKDYVWKTLNQNLFLLKKYPNYVFNFEGGVKYAWMKEYYPQEYEEMKRFIKTGRWHISGASWDATDVLVPSIESGIRNILLGQEYYRKEFGVESTDIFLPDCFGFGWTLPTIATHCGLIGFSSQKLGWRNHPFYGDKKIPFPVGLWKGIDGSSVMFAHGYNYTNKWKLGEDLSASKDLERKASESPLNVTYHYYGTGDTGGSPNLNSVDAVEKSLKKEGPVQVISAASDQMYKDFMPFANHPEMPVYDGELLMDVHGTGCYTSQAAMKLYNRQNELLGDAAERSSVSADLLGLLDYPSESLTESWRRVIFHQFHDDLTGTSIPRAYEFSWNDELLSLKQFSTILTSSVGAVASRLDTRVKGTPVVLYNALGTEVTDVVEIAVETGKCPKRVAAYDGKGKEVPSQLVAYKDGKAHLLVEATVPANGFAVYGLRLSGTGAQAEGTEANMVENSVYRITLDAQGDITSIVDKRCDKELVRQGKTVRLALFTENKSYSWPAWEIMKETLDAEPVSITDGVKMTLLEDGALRKTLRIEKRYGNSVFHQYICLYEGELADRIDFKNEVEWHTPNALLKAEFPLNLTNEKATYDLGLGSVQRGNNKVNAYEVYAHYWADLTDRNNGYGVTVMNDCKYGWDKPDDHTLRLTLLHTPETKKGYAYQDKQDFGYHTFTYSIVGHAGGLEQAEASRKADVLNQPLKAFFTSRHAGSLGKSFSLASSDNGNVAIKALKRAESSDEYVVRVYERSGKQSQDARLTFAADIVSAVEADGTEKTIGEADFDGRQLHVSVRPNGIRTYKIRLAKTENRPLEHKFLDLDFDKKCFSWNQLPGDANFQSGYAYAAELIPSRLTAAGIPFRLENQELLNGMKCEGDTLFLPAEAGYNRLYVLAAAATSDRQLACTFRVGDAGQEVNVPSYTGFIGQWGHEGHTNGYLNPAEVAYVGTHRHSADGDQPYEFTYMFKYGIDIPDGATEVILPDCPDVVLFAATLVREETPAVVPVSVLFRTSVRDGGTTDGANVLKENLLKPEHIVAWSGYVNEKERPAFMVDGDEETKWCDVGGVPAFVEFDLGREAPVSSWKMTNAGVESSSYITSTCLLQARNRKDEDWRTIDVCAGNVRNMVTRQLEKTEKVRYLRLLVVQPTQEPDSKTTRIYEFAVYE